MIPLNPGHVAVARRMLAQFRAAGHASPQGGGTAPPGSVAQHAHPASPRPDLQRSPVGWPETRDALAGALDERLKGASLPFQAETSYCGCAAFLVALLVDRPDLYTAYAIGLWTDDDYTFKGAARRWTCVPPRAPSLAHIQATIKVRKGAISDLDWMTMASLSASSHGGAPATVRPPGGMLSDLNAITWPAMIRRWFSSVGAAPQLDAVGVGLLSRSIDDFLDLLRLWDNH